jgi:hypothetical protein
MVDSGEKCIKSLEKNRCTEIHLILLDYRLGSSMLGDSVALKIKEYNGTKIILISLL